MPKYSLIVPVYQCKDHIASCVDSILRQSFSDFELVLVDDGSTDGSAMICNELAKTDTRVRVFHKPNGGAASARNYGLDHAVGTYVFFIDGDDVISPNSLQLLDDFTSEYNLLIFGMSFDYYRGERLIRSERLSCLFGGYHLPIDIAGHFSEFFADNQLSSACNKVFDRAIIEKNQIRFREGMALYEDFDFVVNYLQYVSSVYCVNQCLYFYRNDLNKIHSKARFQDLTKIRLQLHDLNNSLLSFWENYPKAEVMSVSANLYLSLLQQYLLHKSNKAKDLSKIIPSYCSEKTFRGAIANGGQLEKERAFLLKQIDNGDFDQIALEYRHRRIKAFAKDVIKRLIGQ